MEKNSPQNSWPRRGWLFFSSTFASFLHKEREKVSLLLVLLLMPLTALAGHIGETEALQRVQSFLKERGKQQVATNHIRIAVKGRRAKAKAANVNDYYVFNVGNNDGFVIVSGDDRTTSILGYADQGSISDDTMPDGLRYLLNGYVEQMEWLDEHGVEGNEENNESDKACKARRLAAARTAIAPLIQTRWDQITPYNNNCPKINGEKTVTGCVATTLAQLMYYYQYPTEACNAIPGYTLTTMDKDKQTYTTDLNGLEATTFNWDDMSKTYGSGSSTDANAAVAKLMQYCGWSLQMIYGLSANGGSSSYSECIPSAIKDYFGYDGGVHHTYRKNYNYVDWVNLIYSELAERRPVALGGQSAGGGHSFVCDGYDTNDYFHINWGWGGSSDGYYRLSLLNPYEQGAGGSSTLDGFSFSQDAVIGIQPPISGTTDYCLSLEALQFSGSDNNSSTKTITRENVSSNFTDIELYATLCSYKAGTHSFDYAVQMVDSNGNVVHTLASADNNSMKFNTDLHPVLTNLTIPSNVAEGTYYIKVVSRPNGTNTWQECYDGDRYQLTAIINGNELTISVPITAIVSPESATIEIMGNSETEGYLTQGYEQEVIVKVTGGNGDYHGNLFLYVNKKLIMGKSVDIPANETVDVHFVYTPTSTGDNVLDITRAKSTNSSYVIKSKTIQIAGSDATDQLDLSFEADITNLSGDNQLYGNAFRATITAKNSSTENSYVGWLNCSVRKWTITETITDNGDNTYTISTSASWESVNLDRQTLVVAKKSGNEDGKTTLDFAFDNLENDGIYSFRFTYKRSDKNEHLADAIHLGLDENDFGSLTVTDGFRMSDATGNIIIYPSSREITVSDDICFVDLSGFTSLEGITINTNNNPNCLYLIANGATQPEALSGKNVVVGSSADNITLQDGYDFYSPIDFTATSISYTRTFNNGATGTGGWNTICLPFEVSSVNCEGFNDPIDWFHNANDTEKNFWVRAFTYENNGMANFDFASQMTANTPYIIAVPGDLFDEDYRMTGKNVTFRGSNANITATKTASVSGNNYKFCGSTVRTTLSEVYGLNSNGSTFVKMKEGTTATVPAFRAWFEAVNISSLSRTSLTIGNGTTTGIEMLPMVSNEQSVETSPWYTPSGAKLSKKPVMPGLYINNGKKIVIR